ncbi:single-stranded DNA-binding protein [Schleiferiaceae bacterium]|jgi:single-strand DNA-binding protein|nr:single-stranded DNA-binding protein [Flavobacteriales bacterium]MDC1022367.1 single-stranded DNA-binding protein [Schleiferiaceae bacterium]|tara:strand:+ start:1609 stop:2088 length:480 start_codon:yes stop_codon:yes gene_type:complete
MAGTLNKVMLIGNLGKDPEIMHFDNGGSLVKFPIATSETYTNRDGQRVTNTEWHNIVINAKGLVDVAHKYLKKGHKVYLEGRIKTKKWQDQSGADRYSTEIQANQMTMLTSRAESEGLANDSQGSFTKTETINPISSQPLQSPSNESGNNTQETDDLPF